MRCGISNLIIISAFLTMSGSSTSCTTSGEVSLIYIKRKHGVVLLHGGHQYYVKKKYPSGLSVWECSQRKKKCKGVIKIRVSFSTCMPINRKQYLLLCIIKRFFVTNRIRNYWIDYNFVP